MTLVVETGAGLSTAESFVSVADAQTYADKNGFLEPIGSDASGFVYNGWVNASDTVKEQCLRKATTYLQGAYRLRWAGTRTNSTQALDWPRYGVPKRDAPGGGEWMALYPNNTVPAEVVQACAELAIRAADGDLNPDLSRGVLKEAVGALSVEYDPASPQATRFRAIDMLLEPLLRAGGSGIRVMRA